LKLPVSAAVSEAGSLLFTDPALRESAENAARQTMFAPVLLSGRPIKVKGKIVYNFIVDKSDKPPRVGAIHGPLLEGRAFSIPPPIYPEESRSVNVKLIGKPDNR
jgi:hypothetical protein